MANFKCKKKNNQHNNKITNNNVTLLTGKRSDFKRRI